MMSNMFVRNRLLIPLALGAIVLTVMGSAGDPLSKLLIRVRCTWTLRSQTLGTA